MFYSVICIHQDSVVAVNALQFFRVTHSINWKSKYVEMTISRFSKSKNL